MRLGVATSFWGLSPEKWAEKMVSLGGKSVVFPVDHTADPALIDEYVRQAQAHDLLIAEVGIWRNAIAADPVEAEKNIEYSVKQLQLADRIGARCCVNVAGSLGARWDGGYRENYSKEAWDRTVQMIQTIIDRAQPTRTYFTMEPMPWMIPSGPQEYLQLIQDVNRERFAVHMDIINMINTPQRYFFAEEFLQETFDLLGPAIKSCHLKDIRLLEDFTFQLKECGCGEGTFPIRKYLELATQADPDMPMIIEHLTSDEAYVESIGYVQKHYM